MIDEKAIWAWNRSRVRDNSTPLEYFKHGYFSGMEEKQNHLEISNQQLKLGELLNNDLQKEVDSSNKLLEEKQKIIDEQLGIIRFYADENNWSEGERFKRNTMIGDSDSLKYMGENAGKKAREYLQRMEGKK